MKLRAVETIVHSCNQILKSTQLPLADISFSLHFYALHLLECPTPDKSGLASACKTNTNAQGDNHILGPAAIAKL